jgi:hypothetical protein
MAGLMALLTLLVAAPAKLEGRQASRRFRLSLCFSSVILRILS